MNRLNGILVVLLAATLSMFATTAKQTKPATASAVKQAEKPAEAKPIPTPAKPAEPVKAAEPNKTLQPTDAERAELDSVQKDVVIYQQQIQLLQMQYSQAQSALSNAYGAVQEKANKIKKAHNWPDSVLYDLNSHQFEDHK